MALLSNMVDRVKGNPACSLERSVLEHLRTLLNTRQGSSLLDPLYGTPDFTDSLHDFPRGLITLQRAIETAIRRGEPRLQAVSVRPSAREENSLVLSFDVAGRLEGGAVIRFRTEVTRGGQIQLR